MTIKKLEQRFDDLEIRYSRFKMHMFIGITLLLNLSLATLAMILAKSAHQLKTASIYSLVVTCILMIYIIIMYFRLSKEKIKK